MSRIAIAGFQHETNSFSATPTDLDAFCIADSWPGLLSGDVVVAGTRGLNLPIAGFAAAARAETLLPILWCAAEPAGPVTDAAFDTIAGQIIDGLKAAGPLDALYLDLHGAMITQSHDDGEGDLLQRIRTHLGPDLPIVISLDMHANITWAMRDATQAMTVFRTYPHLDMAGAGARAYRVLRHILDNGPPACAHRDLPYLIPMHAQFTGADPARALYRAVAEVGEGPAQWAEFAVGFTGGDTPVTGASFLVYAPDRATAERIADGLYGQALAAETAFDQPLPTATEAVRAAMAMPAGRPVVLADVQDNPGGGGSSDTTWLLRALVDEGAQGAALGVLHDPEAAATAHAIGEGGLYSGPLGGRSESSDTPYPVRARIEALSYGEVHYEGEMYGGGTAQIGPTALLRIEDPTADVRVVVSSQRNQCLDRAYFRHIGLVPEQARILAVKSTVHFRADFEPIAQAVIPLGAPGALGCDLPKVGFSRLRPGLRLGPNGAPFCPETPSGSPKG